jgi:hypothetical protein
MKFALPLEIVLAKEGTKTVVSKALSKPVPAGSDEEGHMSTPDDQANKKLMAAMERIISLPAGQRDSALRAAVERY